MGKPKKMRFCFNCGEELGFYADYDPMDHCGKTECSREAQYAAEAERSEAHERLDQDNGWDRW